MWFYPFFINSQTSCVSSNNFTVLSFAASVTYIFSCVCFYFLVTAMVLFLSHWQPRWTFANGPNPRKALAIILYALMSVFLGNQKALACPTMLKKIEGLINISGQKYGSTYERMWLKSMMELYASQVIAPMLIDIVIRMHVTLTPWAALNCSTAVSGWKLRLWTMTFVDIQLPVDVRWTTKLLGAFPAPVPEVLMPCGHRDYWLERGRAGRERPFLACY